MGQQSRHFIIKEHVLILAVAAALCYWIIETAIQVWVLKTGSFGTELFSFGSHKIWHRTLVTGLFVLFGMYARKVIITQQRTQESLRKAQLESQQYNKELAAKNKELESVVFVVSHNIRSTIVNIQGFGAELATTCNLIRSKITNADSIDELQQQLQNAIDVEIPQFVAFITKNTALIDKLLNGLLLITRIARQEIKPAVLNVNEIITTILSQKERQIKANAVRIETQALPSCTGDPDLIFTVFSNLIDNAIKYRDKSRPGVVRIYGHIQDNEAIYCIEDNGIGIAPAYHKKIFDIFERLTPSGVSGEGLGLTIARLILERHDGKIWVESEPGIGSKFFLSLQLSSVLSS